MAILAGSKLSVRPEMQGENPSSPAPAGMPAWQQQLRAAVRSGSELCRRLRLPAELATDGRAGEQQFSVFVPEAYLRRIQPGDAADPLLRQVLPLAAEGAVVEGFSADPVGDTAATLRDGVLQKYAGRALLVTTGACAVHCRYCFRRHFPYEEAPHSEAAWDRALDAIRDDRSISEVILSGGDPLMLVDSKLQSLVHKLATIQHLTRLRVHTRLPIMIPERVNDAMLEWLTGTRLTPVMVIHANHAQELDDTVARACDKLRRAGVMLLNQAVLLGGVNDSVDAQRQLCERLVQIGVFPYYLHQLDRVAGAAHFETPLSLGRAIIQELRHELPGYAVPRFVRELPGEPSKTILA